MKYFICSRLSLNQKTTKVIKHNIYFCNDLCTFPDNKNYYKTVFNVCHNFTLMHLWKENKVIYTSEWLQHYLYDSKIIYDIDIHISLFHLNTFMCSELLRFCNNIKSIWLVIIWFIFKDIIIGSVCQGQKNWICDKIKS